MSHELGEEGAVYLGFAQDAVLDERHVQDRVGGALAVEFGPADDPEALVLVETAGLGILLVDVDATHAPGKGAVEQEGTNAPAPQVGGDEQHLEHVAVDAGEADGAPVARHGDLQERHRADGIGHVRLDGVDLGRGQKRMGRLDRRAPKRDHVRDKAIRPVFAGDFDEFCLHGASFPGVGHTAWAPRCKHTASARGQTGRMASFIRGRPGFREAQST